MRWKTPIVGRDAELAELAAQLRLGARGEFRAVLLTGEAEVGKTRLAEEVLARHKGRATGLFARASPIGETASFGMWTQALEGHFRTLPSDLVQTVVAGCLEDLATVLNSVAAI